MPLALSQPSAFGFADVLRALPTSDEVTVVTWSIDTDPDSELLKLLRVLKPSAKLTLITNLPSRFPSYRYLEGKQRALKTITKYIEAIAPQSFPCETSVQFCFANHSKIILCETVAYVGSANFTTPSQTNFEGGVLTRDRAEIAKINEFVGRIKKASIPYLDLRHSKDLQLVLAFLSQLASLEEEVTEASYDFRYNPMSDDYDPSFDFEKFAIPDSVQAALKKIALICQAVEDRADGDNASPAESHFADQYLSGTCQELIDEAERINSRVDLPPPLNKNALESKLHQELSYLHVDGDADEITSSAEYNERWNDAVKESREEWESAAENQVKRFTRELRALRAKLLEGFLVNPTINNTGLNEAGA